MNSESGCKESIIESCISSPRDIDEAIRRKQRFEQDPGAHIYQEE
jgi:hypothetical protein